MSLTGVFSCLVTTGVSICLRSEKRQSDEPVISGVAGGVVQSKYFQIKFGVRPASGPADQNRIDDVSSNVVSVLQAGAFFGALSSAPVSGGSLFPQSCLDVIAVVVMGTYSYQTLLMYPCFSVTSTLFNLKLS